MKNTRCGSTIGQRDMYHIFAPQGHRQDGAFLGKLKALPIAAGKNLRIAADPPGLIELPPAILTRVRGMNEQVNTPLPRRRLDARGVRSADRRGTLAALATWKLARGA